MEGISQGLIFVCRKNQLTFSRKGLMGARLILWFDEIDRNLVPNVGGKSANLGEMMRIGVPVPDGFAITTEAYEKFMGETGAADEINQYLNKFKEGLKNVSQYQEASQAIRHIIETKEIPQYIGDAISSYYEMLCEKCGKKNMAVAVRSSGVAEDSASSSFAGQFESFLNVAGKRDLLDKTKLCWSSQFTTQAISYRVKHELPRTGTSMSVAVQRMTRARSAGVGFTSHPITGDTSKIVLEGNWGLGESIVQGVVVPDKFIVDKETLTLIDKKVSTKEKLIQFSDQGVVMADVPSGKRQLACLSDEEALKVAELAKRLEAHYGAPQDMEWAVDEALSYPDNIFLVQTRPITVAMQKKEGESTEYIVDLMTQMFRQIRESEPDPTKKKKKK
jgi:pyruvate,water dikinase